MSKEVLKAVLEKKWKHCQPRVLSPGLDGLYLVEHWQWKDGEHVRVTIERIRKKRGKQP